MSDSESKIYQPNSQSRHLIRHVTVTGDVIHEYEYQEDGHTRLFTLPSRVRQNRNTDIDICEVKLKSVTSSELVMLSLSWSLKWVYCGQKMENVNVFDVMCDTHCNTIACEGFYSQVHLLSHDGEFLKYWQKLKLHTKCLCLCINLQLSCLTSSPIESNFNKYVHTTLESYQYCYIYVYCNKLNQAECNR